MQRTARTPDGLRLIGYDRPGDDGHLALLANRVGEVHAWLADRL